MHVNDQPAPPRKRGVITCASVGCENEVPRHELPQRRLYGVQVYFPAFCDNCLRAATPHPRPRHG